MNACAFVAFWGAFISLLSVVESLAQQTSTPKLEVIRGTGSAIILPRQAGSKDAPDVSLCDHTPSSFKAADLKTGSANRNLKEPPPRAASDDSRHFSFSGMRLKKPRHREYDMADIRFRRLALITARA